PAQNGTHRRLFLVDSDIAAGKSAAGGITVAQSHRNGVQPSWLSVISHTHVEPNSDAVLQTSLTAELGVNACNGETLNFACRYADTGSGVAKGIRTEGAAVVCLVRMKVESDFVLLVVEGAAAIDLRGHRDSRIVEFRARDRDAIGTSPPCDDNHAGGQEGVKMVIAKDVDAAGR